MALPSEQEKVDFLEAAREQQWDVVLLKLGEKPEIVNAQIELAGVVGASALHHAAMHAALEVVQQLLRVKASAHLKNEEGKTPLQVATTDDKKVFLRKVMMPADRYGGALEVTVSTLHKSNYLEEYDKIVDRDALTHQAVGDALAGAPCNNGSKNPDVKKRYLNRIGVGMDRIIEAGKDPGERAAWLWTTDAMYKAINRDALIPDQKDLLRKYVPFMSVLNRYIQRKGPKRRIVTFRGSQSDPKKFVKSQWYRFNMYTASSINQETAARFAEQCIFQFDIPQYCQNAGCLEEVTANPEETEYLMPPYTAVRCSGFAKKKISYLSLEDFQEYTKEFEVVKFAVAEDSLLVEEKFEALAKLFMHSNYFRLMQRHQQDPVPDKDAVVAALQKAGAQLPAEKLEEVLARAQDVVRYAPEGITESMTVALLLATLERRHCKAEGEEEEAVRPPYLVLGEIMEKDNHGGLLDVLPCLRSIEGFFLRMKTLNPNPGLSSVWVERRKLSEDFLGLCREPGTRFIFNTTMFLVCDSEDKALFYKREGSTIFQIVVPADAACPWIQHVEGYVLERARFQLALRPYTIVKSLGPLQLQTDAEVPAFVLEMLAEDNPQGDVLAGIRVTAG